jgi:arylsulfatase A-like enzyme
LRIPPKAIPATGSDLVAVHATRIPDSPRTLYGVPPIDIAVGSRLRFALGVLAPARNQGPVRFRVDACLGDDCAPVFDETIDPAAAPGWLDREVSLENVAGRRALRFETEYRGERDDGFTLPVWGDPTLLTRDTRTGSGPSLVLLSIDTLRADHLGAYGHPRATSPFLDEVLADGGSVFEAFMAAATSTDPSHMTMFTSLAPLVHGVTTGLKGLSVPTVTLAEVLRARGFATGAFTENGLLAHGRGFGRGFGQYKENKSPIFLSPNGQVEAVFAQARRFLEAHAQERIFLFLHTYQVHAPYVPPLEYRKLFAGGDDWRLARTASEMANDYDREIRYVDDQLREFFSWMRDRDLDEQFLWVVTSDHGEQFLEHGCLGHECAPYQEVVHVPLIFHGPGIPARRRVASPVAHIDLMPTLLDLLGVATPVQAQGISLAGAVRGAPGFEIPSRPLFTSGWAGAASAAEPFLAVRLGHRKLLRIPSPKGDRYRYFDLSADPGEAHDVGDGGERAADLREAMQRYESESREVRAGLRRAAPNARPEPVPFDPDREEQLRSLGYVE